MSSNVVVRAEHLRKFYGDTPAMDDVSFEIPKGAIVGLIGPNGAGKTTTLKAMLGLTRFDGDMQVFGLDPRRERHAIMERVAYIADVGVLPAWMRVTEAMAFVAGVHPRFSLERCKAMLAETGIKPDSKVKQLSKGMVTQLHLSLIMAIDAELLILDEPTLGLDILYRKAFFDRLINDYFDHETSIVISTHQVDEISSLLTHLFFINKGKLILDRSMDSIEEDFCEVMVTREHAEAARKLAPLYCHDVLGQQSMLFEGADRQALAGLGDLRVPAISDLFIAKIRSCQEC